jgi:hypothetical protein
VVQIITNQSISDIAYKYVVTDLHHTFHAVMTYLTLDRVFRILDHLVALANAIRILTIQETCWLTVPKAAKGHNAPSHEGLRNWRSSFRWSLGVGDSTVFNIAV